MLETFVQCTIILLEFVWFIARISVNKIEWDKQGVGFKRIHFD